MEENIHTEAISLIYDGDFDVQSRRVGRAAKAFPCHTGSEAVDDIAQVESGGEAGVAAACDEDPGGRGGGVRKRTHCRHHTQILG